MNETAFESWIWCIGLVTRVLLCDVVLYVCVVVYVSVITCINLFSFQKGPAIQLSLQHLKCFIELSKRGKDLVIGVTLTDPVCSEMLSY